MLVAIKIYVHITLYFLNPFISGTTLYKEGYFWWSDRDLETWMKSGARSYEILTEAGNTTNIAIPKLCFVFQLHKQILNCQQILDKKRFELIMASFVYVMLFRYFRCKADGLNSQQCTFHGWGVTLGPWKGFRKAKGPFFICHKHLIHLKTVALPRQDFLLLPNTIQWLLK